MLILVLYINNILFILYWGFFLVNNRNIFLFYCVICLYSMIIKYNVGLRFKEKLFEKSIVMKKYLNGGKVKFYVIFLSCEYLD